MNIVNAKVIVEPHTVPKDEIGPQARVAYGEKRHALSLQFERPTDLCDSGRAFGGLAVLQHMIKDVGEELTKPGTRCTVSFDPRRDRFATIKILKDDLNI